MKKMIITLLLCIAMLAAAGWSWLNYHDALAGVFVVMAVVPSCFFEEARQEYESGRHE